ncbi:VOC family protein [Isoptericola chiayiensis]|uniref:VOC family protein n=1 Tax=Isoptericola chiayiensis TaxID=579446 RepID=A0ABP8YEG5_9MICO|nr:VOC family protein [Isoptericola chiayiensis]NOW00111.1 putative glyoxalase superfamily protein PhnB [Isoptericola chiayiensis]
MTALWVTLRYRDADAALTWLRAVGFTEDVVHRDPDDRSVVQHAQLSWPGGGGLMLGTHRESPGWPVEPGHGATYAVTDDVDRVFEAAVVAGGRAVMKPADQDYGGRSATVADPEGNLWSFGSYRP